MSDDADLKRLSALLQAHAEFELANDLDATLSTVCAEPHYELVALGWQIDGRDAVREMYRRVLAVTDVADREIRVIMAEDDTLCYEGYSIDMTPTGRHRARFAVVAEFEGDLVKGERIYSDAHVAKHWSDALGDDFGDVPGVSRLS